VLAGIMDIAESIEQSQVGVAIAESRYWWPIFEGTHLLSLSISFGLILLTDLRLVGVFLRHVPVTDVLHQLRPYVLTGFAFTFVSGGLLFWSEAAKVTASPLWAIKCLLIALGGLNALYFEFVIAKRPEVVENRLPLPLSVRYAGFASISIWAVVVICGRLLAYLPG
jgi:hypothetical protein